MFLFVLPSLFARCAIWKWLVHDASRRVNGPQLWSLVLTGEPGVSFDSHERWLGGRTRGIMLSLLI
jgi:hypothetical protein